jgi:hypothetical protein
MKLVPVAALLLLSLAAPAAAAGLRDARAPAAQLERAGTGHSHGVTFRRYRQELGGVPVLGAQVVVTDARGRSGDLLVDESRRFAAPAPATVSHTAAIGLAMRAAAVRSLRAPARASEAILPARGGARRVWRVLVASARPFASLEVLVDARSGRVLRTRDLLQRATGTASIYDPNPVVANGGTAGLSDGDDADSALLTSLRVPKTLQRLDASTCLRGSFVEATPPSGDVCDPGRDFTAVTRADDRFEALMAYFHIDRAQSYVQSLGFPNVLNSRIRANVDAPIPGPMTEDGQDNSYFDPLSGELTFGTGWADDAEDAETIVHEYAHALQDAQIPGFPLTAGAAAIGEGWGDYLASALSATYTPRAGFDGCWDEWDAFASGLGNCLRRVDWNLRPGQASSDCPDVSDEHCAGEVWSGALWAIRSAIGGRTADRLVLQSHFSLTASASFGDAALALFAADRALYGGAYRAALKAVLAARGLVDPERLDDTPADATPLAIPGQVSGKLAAGSDDHDVYAVNLSARSPIRFRLSAGELRLLPPGSGSVGAAPVAGPGADLRLTPPTTGRYYLDVRGSGSYTLSALRDDRDGDGVGDASDKCPDRADPRQRDWDGDGHGDLCDRSARVALTGVSRKGRRLTVRARMWPVTLSPKAFRLRVERRACAGCRLRPVRSRRAKKAPAGRVKLAFRVAPGRYRLRAALSAKGYEAARSRPRAILVRR